MSTEFERDMAEVREKLDAARQDLRDVLTTLSAADLERARRGGWTVRRVLEHVIHSEWLYSKLAHHLRGQPVPDDPLPEAPSSPDEATQQLDASRQALLEAVEGVDEDSFYELRTVGHEEYSILSLLENTALHDREHSDQIQEILTATQA